MLNRYFYISEYLQFIHHKYNVQVCVKDFCGFIPINKELDEALQPFLAHTNPFCLYLKSEPERYHLCLRMIRGIYDKCEKHPAEHYFGVCHAGLGEYVVPVRRGNLLLGSINAGFFQASPARTEWCIRRACRYSQGLSAEHALELYRRHISPATIQPEDLLVHLHLLAEYLGQTYPPLSGTHTAPNLARRYHSSSEDDILSHAMEYIRQNSSQHITVEELADFCHCSLTYLSRVFKKRTGVNLTVYINKIRIERAKNHLLLSGESIADIALAVGFNDPNYFSRVFSQIIGIPPTEFRRRFRKDLPAAHTLFKS